jgi:glycosyltransferase involved in cell wall biosynthesis
VPVVSTEVSGVPELVDSGINGFLVPPRAPEPLAESIRTLLEDPALRRRMAEAGRRRVLAEFSVERNTRRILALFQATMGLRPVSADAPDDAQAGTGSELARQDGSS